MSTLKKSWALMERLNWRNTRQWWKEEIKRMKKKKKKRCRE